MLGVLDASYTVVSRSEGVEKPVQHFHSAYDAMSFLSESWRNSDPSAPSLYLLDLEGDVLAGPLDF